MKIALTGGGSGGHITPILAVAAELKRLRPELELIYIGQKGDNLADIVAKDPNIDQVFAIRAGKFRRFHGEGLKQLLDVPIVAKNLRDIVYIIIGCYQSWRLMRRLKPRVLFTRGGYVSVPAAFGAHLCKVPYITHDSDPIPSLANRIIARHAKLHAVALPVNIYPYPPNKTVTTGIPLSKNFVSVTAELKQEYRKQLQLPSQSKLLFVIGGGLGSQAVNLALSDALPHLLKEHQDLYVYHVVGRANQTEMFELYSNKLSKADQGRLKVFGFIDDVYRYSGAADVIITRAGATNLAEFALQGKACIVIPSSFLTAGHQLKNAEYLAQQEAVIVVNELDLQKDSNRLARQASELLFDVPKQQQLAANLQKFAKPEATNIIAKLILDQL